jgi:hypothetical protein
MSTSRRYSIKQVKPSHYSAMILGSLSSHVRAILFLLKMRKLAIIIVWFGGNDIIVDKIKWEKAVRYHPDAHAGVLIVILSFIEDERNHVIVHKLQRNETKRNETQRNATQRNATQRNETKRNETKRNTFV